MFSCLNFLIYYRSRRTWPTICQCNW